MKKLSAALLISAALLFTGCITNFFKEAVAPGEETTPIAQDITAEDGVFLITETANEAEEINGEKTFPVVGLTFVPGMPNSSETDRFQKFLGKEQTVDFGNGLSAIFKITNATELSISFPSNKESSHTVMSNLDANPEWFNYLFIPVSATEFYISDGGGHEGIPQFKYFNKKSALNFNEAVKEKLAGKFEAGYLPDKGYVFPPFSIAVSDSYIRFEEQNYCCDTLYNSEDEERSEYRKVFILDKETLEIISEDKTER